MIKVVIVCLAMLMTTGCLSVAQREQLRDNAHKAIITYVEAKGQEKALEYINKLEAEGRLGSVNAEKLREAIPMGIDKLKEVMGEIEHE